ncbi:hypothetical protein MTO96_048262 [Rhipicephalus appendiculatus]
MWTGHMWFQSLALQGRCYPNQKKYGSRGPLQRPNHGNHLCPPVFRQVHGLRPAERRLYYRSLFENGPPEDYAPPKLPKAQASSPCSNQPTHAVHAQAEARKPRGAQAAPPRIVINNVNWPSRAQASQDQTGYPPTCKSWAQKVTPSTDSQPRGPQAYQARSNQFSQPRRTQPSQSRGTQARQHPVVPRPRLAIRGPSMLTKVTSALVARHLRHLYGPGLTCSAVRRLHRGARM